MTAKRWLAEIKAYEASKDYKAWVSWAKKSRDRYLLRREGDDAIDTNAMRSRYNMFWANVELLKPYLYPGTPKPIVTQRSDDNNPVANTASQVIERVLSYMVQEHGFGASMRSARDDYLLVARGVVWVRYEPQFAQIPSLPTTITDDAQVEPVREMKVFEETRPEYIHWTDFGHTDARTWEEVVAVWRRVRLRKSQVESYFGGEIAAKVAYDAATLRSEDNGTDGDRDTAPDGIEPMATIYEVWDKDRRKVCFVSKGVADYLKEVDDPLGLPSFFPCSKPIYGTLGNHDLFPVSDYRQYITQLREMDSLTSRIIALTDAVRASGVYDSEFPELKDLLNSGKDNVLIPVTNWAALAQKGALDGSISLIPMKEIADTLLTLYEAREKVKQDAYEITGLSDILRGATAPQETATAQKIKSSYVTRRLAEKQDEISRFVRNTIDIMGSIVCRLFDADTLKMMSGMQLLTVAEKQSLPMLQQLGANLPSAVMEAAQHPTWEEVIAFIRDEPERRFQVTIETDSTVDQSEQQQQAMGFLQMVGGFLQQAKEAPPQLAPLLGQMLEWAVRRFPIGRDLQDAIADTVEQAKKLAQNPPPPPPDPKMAQVQANAQIGQQKLQQEGQLEQQRIQADAQARVVEAQSDMQIEALKAHLAQEGERQRMANEAHLQAMQAMMQQTFDRWKAELDARTKVEVAEIAAGATLDAAQIAAANQASESD